MRGLPVGMTIDSMRIVFFPSNRTTFGKVSFEYTTFAAGPNPQGFALKMLFHGTVDGAASRLTGAFSQTLNNEQRESDISNRLHNAYRKALGASIEA